MSLPKTYRRVLLAAAVLVGVLAVGSDRIRSACRDAWEYSALKDQLRQDEERHEELTAADQATTARIAVKTALVADLVAGRCSLAAAAERFHALNQDNPGSMSMIRQSYEADTDAEDMALNVLDFARLHPHPSRAAKARTLARLWDEYHRLFPKSPAATH